MSNWTEGSSNPARRSATWRKGGVDALIARLRTSRRYAFQDLDRLAVLRRAKVLVSAPDGKDVVSLAGLLALGSYPQEQFPQLMLTFVHYPTTTGAQSANGQHFLDNVALEGPIPVMARDALAAIRRNMSRRAVVTGAGRQDIWESGGSGPRQAMQRVPRPRFLRAGDSQTRSGDRI